MLSPDHDWIEVDGVTRCAKCGAGYFTRCFELTWWRELPQDRCDPPVGRTVNMRDIDKRKAADVK